MKAAHPQETSFSPRRALALFLICTLGPLGILLAYQVLMMETGIRITSESGFSVVRDKSLSPLKKIPPWHESVPVNFDSTHAHQRELIAAQNYAGPGEIHFFDQIPERELQLRSIVDRSSDASILRLFEMKIAGQEWRTIRRLPNIVATHLFEDPVLGISIAYSTYDSPQRSLWVRTLETGQAMQIGKGQNLIFAPDKSHAIYVTKISLRRDLIQVDTPRYGFVLWDIKRRELKQISSALISDWRSGIRLSANWSQDSKFVQLLGLRSESIYSVEHDELYQK